MAQAREIVWLLLMFFFFRNHDLLFLCFSLSDDLFIFPFSYCPLVHCLGKEIFTINSTHCVDPKKIADLKKLFSIATGLIFDDCVILSNSLLYHHMVMYYDKREESWNVQHVGQGDSRCVQYGSRAVMHLTLCW